MKVAFLGNCHADVLSRVVRHAYGNDPELDVRYFRTYVDIANSERAFIAKSDLVVRQTADFVNVTGGIETGSARVIGFPLLSGQFLWPFNTRDHPLNLQIPCRVGEPGIFVSTLTDNQVIRLANHMKVGADSSPADIETLLDVYMERDYAKLTNLDRLMEISRVKLRQAADIVGYDLWHIVERDLRSLPVFLTPFHPSEHVMQALCEAVLPEIGFPVRAAGIFDAFLDAYDGDHMFAYAAPLHPSVIAHFGMNVPGRPPTFRFSHEGAISTRDFARRIVMLDTAQPVREALAGLTRGETADAVVAAMSALAPSQQSNPSYFLQFGNLLLRLQRQAEAVEQFAMGLSIAPGHAGLARRLTRTLAELRPVRTTMLTAGDTIMFGRHAVGRNLLLEGWNTSIDGGKVWIEGYAAIMRFVLSGVGSTGAASLSFRAYPFNPSASMQVRIFANSREVGLWDFKPPAGETDRTLHLPPGIGDAHHIVLSFHVDRPIRPVDLGISGDLRSFGIGIEQMTVLDA